MAAIFTPGLTVTEQHIVQKTRQLPLEGEVTVAVGDLVKADDVVAKTSLPGKVFPVNVANQLGVDPGRLNGYMKKGVGDRVTKDEIIAETPGIMGFFKSEAKAVVSGTIEAVSTVTGIVIVQADPIPVEIDAYIDGRVVEVIEGEGCVVQAMATMVQGIFGLGGETKGVIAMAAYEPDDVIGPEHITADHKGKVVIGGSYVTIAGLKKAVEVGAAALVTGGFDYDEIKELLGYEVGVAITGGEELGTTLIVTEGFGKIGMAPATFALLKKRAGDRASVNGATQIRAGVIRPEIVVTDDAEIPTERVAAPEPVGIAQGDLIRGIRAPWFGRIGTVSGLPVQPIQVGSETTVRVLEPSPHRVPHVWPEADVARDPEERPRSAGQVARELDALGLTDQGPRALVRELVSVFPAYNDAALPWALRGESFHPPFLPMVLSWLPAPPQHEAQGLGSWSPPPAEPPWEAQAKLRGAHDVVDTPLDDDDDDEVDTLRDDEEPPEEPPPPPPPKRACAATSPRASRSTPLRPVAAAPPATATASSPTTSRFFPT